MDRWVPVGFADVARVFRRRLRRTTGGAAVAVYYGGDADDSPLWIRLMASASAGATDSRCSFG